MRIPEAIRYLKTQLEASGYDSIEAESAARQYAAWRLNRPVGELFLCTEQEIDQSSLNADLARLQAGEPLQYVIGETEFMGLTLKTAPNALIPRGDSECLLERAAELMAGIPHPRIADICTGSGAFGLAIANLLPDAQVDACDLSREALTLAAENCRLTHLENRVSLYEGDMGAPLLALNVLYDMVMCNPPYIRSGEIPGLPKQLSYEPLLALDGGDDGLSPYRVLAPQAVTLLKPGGFLLVEHGDDQQDEVAEILSAVGLTLLEKKKDWGGRPRGIILQKER